MFGWDIVEGRVDLPEIHAVDRHSVGTYRISSTLFLIVSSLVWFLHPRQYSLSPRRLFFFSETLSNLKNVLREGSGAGLGQHVQRGCAGAEWTSKSAANGTSSASSARPSTCNVPPFPSITSPLADSALSATACKDTVPLRNLSMDYGHLESRNKPCRMIARRKGQGRTLGRRVSDDGSSSSEQGVDVSYPRLPIATPLLPSCSLSHAHLQFFSFTHHPVRHMSSTTSWEADVSGRILLQRYVSTSGERAHSVVKVVEYI